MKAFLSGLLPRVVPASVGLTLIAHEGKSDQTAGWLAGQVMRGGGFGLVGDLIVGVIGALLGGFLFRLLGIGATGLLGQLIVAFIGAVVLLFLLRLIRRR